MGVMKDYEEKMDAEMLLGHVKSARASRYSDDAEELLDQVREADALHPVAACRGAKVTEITDEAVYIDDVPFRSALLVKEAKVGDTIYPCLITAGRKLEELGPKLDDVMLEFLNGVLMTACLDDGLIEISKEIAGDRRDGRMLMVKPGIAGSCELGEQERILGMLPGAMAEAGVILGDDGMLRPAYSSTAVLYLTEGESNLCADWEDPKARAAYVQDLNVIAGHV